ncbi:MAG: argininosuccinate lyase [Desulfobacterales bacterium CG07_land_8_20_14_0_80_52_14]|nr:MAG: argininosuccinate lyase [Desulfobacterales bacterium CG07_land_8_20_14_0_80_52_14]
MTEKLWGGRFSERTDRIAEAFTASIDVDRRLYAYDIEGSIAHCKTLAKAGVITQQEADTLIQGLIRIKKDIEYRKFELDESLEDIHMNIEARLIHDLGKVAQKLHTARSRNDQIVLDVRMFLRDESLAIIQDLLRLRKTVVNLAEANIDAFLPGYTHLQRAQPVLLSHHLMAYYEMFTRDFERFQETLRRIDVMPLGSAALAGTTYPIDRHYTATLLHFPKIAPNSIDAVSDRDFILEFLSDAAIAMVHLSRMSEELVLWSSSEFHFIEIPDAFATGSSIMPQKKNPDVPELTRGKTGIVFGNLMAMLTLMKGLPLSYNRDMQEDKVLLFQGTDTLKACLGVFVAMLPKIKFNADVMGRATASGFLNATDLADYLVAKGVVFRDAHQCVGEAVKYALSQGKELQELSLDELKSFSSSIEKDIYAILETEAMINRRTSFGGTAKRCVLSAIETAKTVLEKEDKDGVAGMRKVQKGDPLP